MSRLSNAEYLELLNVLKRQVDVLEPYQLATLQLEGLTSLEGDRQRVLAAVTSLKDTIANAVTAAQRA